MRFFSVGVEAHGVVAIGQFATGVVAIGQVATGIVAVGQIARGVVAVGQVAVGAVAVGQIGVGFVYGAGMVGVGGLAGGLLAGGVWGGLGIFDAFTLRWHQVRPRLSHAAPRAAAWAVIGVAVWLAAIRPLWDGLFGIGGVLHRMA